MSLWILDTNHVSLFQQNHPAVITHVYAKNPEEIAVTIITFEEQVYGRLNRIRRAKSEAATVLGYTNMRAMLDYFRAINVIDFDLQAYAYFSDLVRQKIRIGTQDLRIAAIALSRDAT
ncbi:MAG: type II toxin-antitoxin system VapC family toxin, partial [Verrucomicrobia bacterium]|nr:type II toxin-antitoxin system VapC family toxin [Leptolyngbya sp. ES-bin-22]